MSKKLTIEFVRGEFEREGYVLLSQDYKGCANKLEYICPQGHNGNIVFNSWRRGSRCKVCGRASSANKRRLSIDFVRAEFEKENYTLLSDIYINNKTLLSYICPENHIGSITWHDWQVGSRCAKCFGNKKLTIEFVREHFEKEGYKLLTKVYSGVFKELKYICPKGHIGTSKWNYWQQGNRCKTCADLNMFGKNNPSWNPSLTEDERNRKDKKRRHILGYKEWKYKVKERDSFTCQVCGQLRGNIVSHHLESYSSNLCLRTILDNGVCLCEKCHKEFHSMYGYKNNTKKQFEEFISVGV